MTGTKVRYVQLDREMKLNPKVMNKNIPYYDVKNDNWYFVNGADKQNDVYLDRLIQEFTGYKMHFRYKWLGETFTRNVFAEVLEDIIIRYKDLNINGFEGDYNSQQILWLTAIKNNLIAQQKRTSAEIPHYCTKAKEWRCIVRKSSKDKPYEERGSIEYILGEFSGCGEKYNFRYDNASKDEKWPDHEHSFAGVIYALISSPNQFSIDGFERQYSNQQLELIRIVKEKLLTIEKSNST